LLVHKHTTLRLPSYNSDSIQYAAVSQPDMNELAVTKFPLPFAKEF